MITQLPQGAVLIDTPDKVPWGRVQVGYFDFPWHYRVRSRKGLSRSAENHYPTLTLGEIRKLPIFDLFDRHAWLFAWVTRPGQIEQNQLFEYYGFRYYTEVFTWYKLTKNGKEFVGTGHASRANTEAVFLYRKGNGLRTASHSVRQVIVARHTGKHSEKPKETYNRIFRLAEGENYDIANLQYTYLEGFARNFWPGYMAFGQDLPEENTGPDVRDLLQVSGRQANGIVSERKPR